MRKKESNKKDTGTESYNLTSEQRKILHGNLGARCVRDCPLLDLGAPESTGQGRQSRESSHEHSTHGRGASHDTLEVLCFYLSLLHPTKVLNNRASQPSHTSTGHISLGPPDFTTELSPSSLFPILGETIEVVTSWGLLKRFQSFQLNLTNSPSL